VANAPITVGAIPEPETAAVGLGALALGAAGLRRWRKKKQQAA
jgi:MYXO-CTERM domain-containing protein